MSICQLHRLPYRADPADYFARVRHAPGAILLDAGRPHAERGRYDLISAWPQERFQVADGETAQCFFQRLRHGLSQLGHSEAPGGCELPFTGGLLGYLSYDFGRHLEALPQHAVDDLQLPEAQLGLYTWALISDHQRQTSQLMFHPALPPTERQRLIELFDAAPAADSAGFHLAQPFQANQDARTYQQAIERIQAYIKAGDCYQVNYAQRFQAPCSGDPWIAYLKLRQACPTPFSGFLSL